MNITLEPMMGMIGLSGGEVLLILLVLVFPVILAAVGVVVFLLIRAGAKPGGTAPTTESPTSPQKPVPPAESTWVMPRKCPQCGSELKPDVPEGLCPTCLLQRGIATEGAAPPGAPPFTPPSLAELAKLFPQLEILEVIGQGGMGAVYKARQPALERFVALKILAPRSKGDLDFEGRFTREARALARLNHPNIVGVHDFGTVTQASTQSLAESPEPGKATVLHYFVMEYVDGPNLRQVEQTGKLTPREALEIIPQICAALQFAHDEGIVHRDIKPENVLLDKKGRVKIADFGLAKILGQEANLRLTGARDVMGTPHYMAPEQVEKPQEVDHRADIYSLGVVLYEMLTGELPLGKFDPPSHRVQVDVRLDDVVLRSLAKNPDRRYQHVSEVQTQLENIAQTPGAASRAESAAAFIQETQARDYDLDIGYCVSRGWDLVKRNFWPMVGVNALVNLILGLVGSFSYSVSPEHSPTAQSGSLISVLLTGPLMGALYLYFLKLVRNERVTLDTAFSGFLSRFLPLFLGSFVSGLLCVLGFLCCILPGFYFMVAWMFTLPLIVDKRLDFWAAMELSRKVVTKHWWKLFGLVITLFALRLVGFMFCIIGLFIAAPLVHASLLYAYEDIFNRPGNGKSGARAGAPVATGGTGVSWRLVAGAAAVIVIAGILGLMATVAITNSTRAHRAHAREIQERRLSDEFTAEGWKLWNDEQWNAAGKKFEEGTRANHQNVAAWNGLGWAQFDGGKIPEAQVAFDRAISIDPNYPGALNGLGQIYFSQRDYEQAESYLLRAAPRAPAAAASLAKIYLLRGNFAEAEMWAQQLAKSGDGGDFAQQMLQAARDRHLSDSLRTMIEPGPPRQADLSAQALERETGAGNRASDLEQQQIERAHALAMPKSIVLARPASNVINASNDVRTVSIWTDTYLEPGESVSGLVKRGTNEAKDTSSTLFVNSQPDHTGTMTGLSWFFGAGLEPIFGGREAEAALAQLEANFTDKKVKMVPGQPQELFSVTNEAGEVMTGYAEFKRTLPETVAGTNAEAIVHLRLSPWAPGMIASSISINYAAEVPPGYALRATANDGRASTHTPAGPHQYTSTWSFNQPHLVRPIRSEPGQPQPPMPAPPKFESGEQIMSRGKAMQQQLQDLADRGAIHVALGKPALIFSTTNSDGSNVQGFLELVGPRTELRDPEQVLAEQAPVVVETYPASGTRDIPSGETEIRVRFSKDMTTNSWSWTPAWDNSEAEIIKQQYYLDDKRTFLMPVRLEPGRTYAMWLNSDKFQSFTDDTGLPAVPYLLIFQTKSN